MRRQIRQHDEVVAAAQAQARLQQKDNQDYQTAQDDIDALQQPEGSIGSDLHALRQDISQLTADLTAEQRDAARGPGSYCYNLDANVDYDVSGNIDYDVQGDLGYDLSSLTSDLSTLRQAVSAVRNDLLTLADDGLSAPAGATAAIRSATGYARQSAATANGYIDQANTDVTTAYATANALATGSCAGGGPGSPPSPVNHIRA